jgi:hypothetical protein
MEEDKVLKLAWYLETELDWNVFYKQCPVCEKKQYISNDLYCPKDGALLVPVEDAEVLGELREAHTHAGFLDG